MARLLRDQKRSAVYIVPLFCLIVGFVTFLVMQGGSDGGEEDVPSLDALPTDGVDGSDAETSDAAEGWGVVEGLLTGDGQRASSLETFLDDLADSAGQDEGQIATTAVMWEQDGSLPDVAADVLRAYRDGVQRAELLTAGYLDLKGCAWGVLVRGTSGWVDAVVVMTDDDERSEVRAVRLTGKGDAG